MRKQMKKLRFLFVALFALATTGMVAQNVQLHYDFGRSLYSEFDKENAQKRSYVTTTVEMFKPDKWGSTFFFVDMDYGKKGVTGAYWEIARELKFWKGPWSIHAEYNGGLNYINHAYLGGATYTYNNKDFSKGFSLSAMYKYIQDNEADAPHNFQLTGTWYMHFLQGKLSFTGFADFWREKHKDFNGNDHEFVFLAEPQFWVNLNRFKGVDKDFNLSFGTEWEITHNFALKDGFYLIPTLAMKWSF